MSISTEEMVTILWEKVEELEKKVHELMAAKPSTSTSADLGDQFNQELLTIEQAKKYLKCSHVFIFKKRKEGLIKSVNAGKKVLIVKSSLDDFLNSKLA